jgi:hypothetical protein
MKMSQILLEFFIFFKSNFINELEQIPASNFYQHLAFSQRVHLEGNRILYTYRQAEVIKTYLQPGHPDDNYSPLNFRSAMWNTLVTVWSPVAGVLVEPYSQLTPLSGVAAQVRQST